MITKSTAVIAAFLLCAVLVIGTLHCSTGSAPETVVVPVGEPGKGDPYNTSGDLCGSSGSASSAFSVGNGGNESVIVSFTGTEDIWVFQLSLTEFEAIQINVEEIYTPSEFASITQQDIDALHADLCAPPSERSERGSKLYQIFQTVLSDRITDMADAACN